MKKLFALLFLLLISRSVYGQPIRATGWTTNTSPSAARTALGAPGLTNNNVFSGATNTFPGTLNVPGTFNGGTLNLDNLIVTNLDLGWGTNVAKGSTTQVQYNKLGNLAGHAALTFDDVTGTLSVGTPVGSAYKLVVDGGPAIFGGATSDTPGDKVGNFTGTAGYWNVRTGTAGDFNVDTYNGGAYLNAFKILQNGETFVRNLYSTNDISALTFTDRSKAPASLKDAYEIVLSMKSTNGHLDHSALSPKVWGTKTRHVSTGRMLDVAVRTNNTVVLRQVPETKAVIEPDQTKRDLGVAVNADAWVIQDLIKRVEALERR